MIKITILILNLKKKDIEKRKRSKSWFNYYSTVYDLISNDIFYYFIKYFYNFFIPKKNNNYRYFSNYEIFNYDYDYFIKILEKENNVIYKILMKIKKLCIRFKKKFYIDNEINDNDNDNDSDSEDGLNLSDSDVEYSDDDYSDYSDYNDYYSDNSDNRFVKYDKVDYDKHIYLDDDEIDIDIDFSNDEEN